MFTPNPFIRLNRFFAAYKLLSYKKQEVILRPTDVPSGVFYIEKGFVRQYIISEEGKELTTIIYKARDLFPIRWALMDIPLQSHFEAMTPLELRRVSREEFLTFLRSEPESFLALTSRIINRLYAILERMEYLAFGNSYNKVCALLLLLAQRFGQKKKSGVIILLPLTHQDIASFLGLSREMVSIAMKKLKDLGIFASNRQHILVRSLRRLEREAALSS